MMSLKCGGGTATHRVSTLPPPPPPSPVGIKPRIASWGKTPRTEDKDHDHAESMALSRKAEEKFFGREGERRYAPSGLKGHHTHISLRLHERGSERNAYSLGLLQEVASVEACCMHDEHALVQQNCVPCWITGIPPPTPCGWLT
jgi:hypothetical protein